MCDVYFLIPILLAASVQMVEVEFNSIGEGIHRSLS